MEKRYKVQELLYGKPEGFRKDEIFMFIDPITNEKPGSDDGEFLERINRNLFQRYLRWKNKDRTRRITEPEKIRRLAHRFGMNYAQAKSVIETLSKKYIPRKVNYTFSRKESANRDSIILRKYKDLKGMSHNKRCAIIAREIYVAESTVRRSVERSGIDRAPSYVKMKSKRNEEIIKRFFAMTDLRFKDARLKILSTEFGLPIGTLRSIIKNYQNDKDRNIHVA